MLSPENRYEKNSIWTKLTEGRLDATRLKASFARAPNELIELEKTGIREYRGFGKKRRYRRGVSNPSGRDDWRFKKNTSRR
jgi:hypothetical protein